MEDNRQDTDFIELEEYLEYLIECANKELNELRGDQNVSL
jgi:hypothetical protein